MVVWLAFTTSMKVFSYDLAIVASFSSIDLQQVKYMGPPT